MSLARVNEESGSTDSRSSSLRTADQETYCCLRELLLHTSDLYEYDEKHQTEDYEYFVGNAR